MVLSKSETRVNPERRRRSEVPHGCAVEKSEAILSRKLSGKGNNKHLLQDEVCGMDQLPMLTDKDLKSKMYRNT